MRSICLKFGLILFFLIINLSCFAITARFDCKNFKIPNKDPYIETYLAIYSPTVKHLRNKNNKLQSALEIFLKVSQKDSLFLVDKYILNGPEVDSLKQLDFNFIDLQRFNIKNGNYKLWFQITDLNDTSENNLISFEQELKINYPENKINFSSVTFLEKFKVSKKQNMLSKSGFDLYPYVSRFYSKLKDTLYFYYEIYDLNLQKDSIFFLKTYVESYENNKIIEELVSFKRLKNGAILPNIQSFLLNNVVTGNYNLVLEVRDRNNEIVEQKKIFFQRFNDNPELEQERLAKMNLTNSFVYSYTRKDLVYFLKALNPIASAKEQLYIKKLLKNDTVDTIYMQRFLYGFWDKRNRNNPFEAWKKYFEEIKKVNSNFKTSISYGFETQRGRVYLQYGPPNERIIELNEVGAYPYEIWIYNTLGNQQNVRFVFYNPTLVKNNFELVHSEAFGEPFNLNWRNIIYQRSSFRTGPNTLPSNYNQNTRLEHNFGRN